MKPLLVIINAHSGGTDDSMLLVEILKKYSLEHKLVKVKTLPEAESAITKASLENYQAVAVLGGDGTVAAVAKQINGSRLPLIILPGGTANALARGINSPLDYEVILSAFAKKEYVIRRLQLVDVNKKHLLLDAHFGLFADALQQTPQQLKGVFGRWAYGIQLIKQLVNSKPERIELEVDGRKISEVAYVCYLINHGSPSILGQSLAPGFRSGMVRLVIVKQTGFWQILSWLILRRFFGVRNNRAIISKRVASVTVHAAPDHMHFDDQPTKPKLPLNFTVSDKNVSVIIPKPKPHTLTHLWLKLRTNYYRYVDHVRRVISGNPSVNYSRIEKNLYLGGQYGSRAAKLFSAWQVKGIVSMRESKPRPVKGAKILHLPTVDHTPPSLEDLEKGVKFISEHLSNNQAVYIHCHLGEGRGPSMAAAYLISIGMRPEDAIDHLQRTRPHARPNRPQIERLIEFSRKYKS